jgi:hypothetical protein
VSHLQKLINMTLGLAGNGADGNDRPILFYTSIPRSFSTTLIGHLYELARAYPIVLLSERLDDRLNALLRDRKLFPLLQDIVSVHQYTGSKQGRIFQNRSLYRLAHDIVLKYRPRVVITANDVYPFEMYLMRLAKRAGAVNLCIQAGMQIQKDKRDDWKKWLKLMDFHTRKSFLMPGALRRGSTEARKHLGHFFYYWVLPILMGELPLTGRASFIMPLRADIRLHECHYHVVLSERDDHAALAMGFPEEKILRLRHPLTRQHKFFKMLHANHERVQTGESVQSATFLLPAEKIGIRKVDDSLIDQTEMLANRLRILSIMADCLRGWTIYVKPHPLIDNCETTRRLYASVSPSVIVVPSEDAVEKYLEVSRVVITGPPGSTALWIASLMTPTKVSIYLDLMGELLGDYLQGVDGILSLNTEEALREELCRIVSDPATARSSDEKPSSGFADSVSLIKHILSESKSLNGSCSAVSL